MHATSRGVDGMASSNLSVRTGLFLVYLVVFAY